MVASSDFSVAARNLLASEGIETLVVTLKDAKALRWIPLIEREFVIEHFYKESTGQLVKALRHGNADAFLDTVVPYEEWLATLNVGFVISRKSTTKVLRRLAKTHIDAGVRRSSLTRTN